MKSGVQWAASWLAPFGFEIVDQISEAATLEAEVINSISTYKSHSFVNFRENAKSGTKNVKRFL